MNLRAAILDSHTMFMEALSYYIKHNIPSVEVVGQYTNASSLYRTMDDEGVDIVIMELSVCERDGIEVIEDLKRDHADVKVVVISAFKEARTARRSMLSGADAFLYKGNQIQEVNKAIYEVTSGHTYLGQGVRVSPKVQSKRKGKVATHSTTTRRQDAYVMKQKLTKREKEILSNLARGKNSRQIGHDLFISHQTVGVHRKNIMRKLGVRSTANLVKLALEKELV